MTLPDSTAGAQLESGFFDAGWLAYLDFYGDPVRVTTAKVSIVPSGSGDADLDGYTFSAVDPQLVSVGEVATAEGGSETLPFALSGIVGPNTDLLNILGDPSMWQGRDARLWAVIYNESGTQQGAIWPVYTGRMSAFQIAGSPEFQTAKVDVESYLSSLKQASNRTYRDQTLFDPSDNTAALKTGAANGATKGVATGSPVQSGYGQTITLPGGEVISIPYGVPF